jgi:diguanylate cyclase (GGDEF)-like protein
VTIFITLFFQVGNQEQQERSLRLDKLAASAANDLERTVAVQQEVLEGLATFFESSEEVTADEFRSFTQGSLSRYPNLQALSWNPLVVETDRQSFEEDLRSEDGLVEFEITERNPEGELVAAEPRPEYVPVAFIEPLETNRAALGFDINSNPVRAEAIARARELGEPAATAPIELVQETGSQSGMLALVPVYESGVLSGFAVGVYRLGDLLADALTDTSLDDVEIRLYDVSEDVGKELVAVRAAAVETSEDLTTAAEPAVASIPLDVYGRTWQLGVIPPSGLLATESRAVSVLIDVGGLISLFLLQAFVLLVTGLERTASRQAMEASQEARTDHLTGLLNRRAFLDQLERVCTRSKIGEERNAVLFLDLDNFKAVNDTAGHEAGDRVLVGVAEALTTSVRSRDCVARLGGDEFAVILNNCDEQTGRMIAENLEALVRAVKVDSVAGEMRVGVSIGVAEVGPEGAAGVDEAIRFADDACYAAKRAGGGVSIYGFEDQAATDR